MGQLFECFIDVLVARQGDFQETEACSLVELLLERVPFQFWSA